MRYGVYYKKRKIRSFVKADNWPFLYRIGSHVIIGKTWYTVTKITTRYPHSYTVSREHGLTKVYTKRR